MGDETFDATDETNSNRGNGRAHPGIVFVFSVAAPLVIPIALGTTRLVGREMDDRLLMDERLSRFHAEITFAANGWTVRDLDSRNGTFVDGNRVVGLKSFTAPRVFRFGDTLAVPCADVDRLAGIAPRSNESVVGSSLRTAFTAVERAAATSSTLLLRGETGTGKELASRLFHERGPMANGPFVAINCAAIPEGLAESLLFGTRRGAYSGAAADAVGLVQSAQGGVLFLDEGGELDLGIQAKLLRVLESREVVPLGASRGVTVDFRLCMATNRDLRAAVAAGGFRQDLYHRIAPPEIVLPPLRERLDEIAMHVTAQIAKTNPDLTAHARLIEECLLRAWPGNVRELQKQVRDATVRAQAEGSDRVRRRHLPPAAGTPFEDPNQPLNLMQSEIFESSQRSGTSTNSMNHSRRTYVRRSDSLTREVLEKTLAEHGGNIANAARSLGMQRTQIYRELVRCSLVRPSRG